MNNGKKNHRFLLSLKRSNTVARYSSYGKTLGNLDRSLTEIVSAMKLPIEKQEIVSQILATSPMATLKHYVDSSEQEKKIIPSFVRKHLDGLVFSAKVFKGFKLELEKMVEKKEVKTVLDQVANYAPIFVSKGIFTLDSWKTLPLSTKEQDFSQIYRQIDIVLLKKSNFFKQLSNLLTEKSFILLNHASWLISIGVYDLENWFSIDTEDFSKILSREGVPSYLKIFYVVNNISKIKNTRESLKQLLHREKEDQRLVFDNLVSKKESLQKMNSVVALNEQAFIRKSKRHQDWTLIAIYEASGVGKTRLAYSFVEYYQQVHNNVTVFNAYAKLFNGITLSQFDSVEQFVRYLLVVALFANYFDFSSANCLPKFMNLLSSNTERDFEVIVEAARKLHNSNDRFDVTVRIDEFQLLLSAKINRKESLSYTLAHELMKACVVLARHNVFFIPIIYGTWTFKTVDIIAPFPLSLWNFEAIPVGSCEIERKFKDFDTNEHVCLIILWQMSKDESVEESTPVQKEIVKLSDIVLSNFDTTNHHKLPQVVASKLKTIMN